MEEGDVVVLKQLQASVESNPEDSPLHFNLGVFLWKKGGNSKESKTKAADQFLLSAKLNPQNGPAFRYLGHYYSQVSVDSLRAIKCYQRALTLSPDDSDAGESICDLFDEEGKETLEISVCREASQKSPRAFWAFRRLGYLQVHQKKWSEAVHSLQHAIRGYPTSADLWEALGLAYQRLGMFTAAIKSYGRAVELESSRVFALVESGNIFLMLGTFRKAVENFQEALLVAPKNVAAHYGLASGFLCLSKECMDLGAFEWAASTLLEASKVARACTYLSGNIYCIWKLQGDIQLTYAKCFPWMYEEIGSKTDETSFNNSIHSWKTTCYLAAVSASQSYQKALRLAPWQANIYTDLAITLDIICSLKETERQDINARRLPEKMSIGGLLLEGWNNEFWVALGCLSVDKSLKQHAFIRSLQLDLSLADAWAYLGKLYREVGKKQLAQQAFDRARSIDPSLALPWAGMSADMQTRKLTPEEAYECCLRAVQIHPVAEFQIGLVNLSLVSGQLSSSQVFGAIQQALQHAPHYPESHNLMGLVFEARHDYLSAATCYRRAHYSIKISAEKVAKSCFKEITINLVRSLCKAGNAVDAVQECEDLKKAGILDWEGLQIYALSLYQLGKNDAALSVVRILAASIKSMEQRYAAVSICFICRLSYFISGCESVIKSILKMPKELFQSTTTVIFVVSSIHALSLNNQLQSIVSTTLSSLVSHDEITRMNFLIALSKLVKYGSEGFIGIQAAINHLRRSLHVYPNSSLLRNLLSYLLLSSNEDEYTHLTARCIVTTSSIYPKEEGLKSACEILGASSVACYSKTGYICQKNKSPSECLTILKLQRWLHQEPWNQNVRYLLTLNLLQKALEERYPTHLCALVERLVTSSLSDSSYSSNSNNQNVSHQYQKFQLLLCASEIYFQNGDHTRCVSNAITASRLLLPNSYIFFAHLFLCRIYASDGNLKNLQEHYFRCLELKTSYHIGWIYLKYIESRYNLQSGSIGRLESEFDECLKERRRSWNTWMALFNLVQGLSAISVEDFVKAEEFLLKSCSLVTTESCLFLCHGVICMELARRQFEPNFISVAIRSLKKAKDNSASALPMVSLMLAQAEASLGSKPKWENNVHLEWFSWPPEMRPAEVIFQMHLVCQQSLESSSDYGSPLRLILRSIHLNPSCLRYWKALNKYME